MVFYYTHRAIKIIYYSLDSEITNSHVAKSHNAWCMHQNYVLSIHYY